MTVKKKKLVIPWNLIEWVHPELAKRNGEISDIWDERLNKIGWLEDVKENEVFSAQEAWSRELENPRRFSDERHCFMTAFNMGDRNGQKRDRQRTQPLIDAVVDFVYNKLQNPFVDGFSKSYIVDHGVIEEIKRILSENKPLEEND